MRKVVLLAPLLVGALLAPRADASASFANRSLGIDFAGFKITGDNGLVDFGLVPLGLQGAVYLDNGFEAVLRVQLMLLYQLQFVGRPPGPGFVWGGGGQVGARYLFLEESIRPYGELHLAVLGIGRVESPDNEASQAPAVFVGPGVALGVDFFVADSISVGGRGFFDLFLSLRAPPRTSFGGAITAATYF